MLAAGSARRARSSVSGGSRGSRASFVTSSGCAPRSLVLDSGDAFQGSLAFDTWAGEPELLALAALGVQAQALGNHELDRGAENLRERYRELATFPLLGANYLDDSAAGVAELVSPFVVLDARGLRVGVIGVANVHSVPALRERPNELGVLARDAAGAVQGAVDALRPIVDVVVVLTHLGLDGDRALVRETSGIDVVLGGHQHVALDEPLEAMDCGGSGEGTILDAWGRERRCTARRVLVAHSGAYAKYLGKLALTLDDRPGAARRDLRPARPPRSHARSLRAPARSRRAPRRPCRCGASRAAIGRERSSASG